MTKQPTTYTAPAYARRPYHGGIPGIRLKSVESFAPCRIMPKKKPKPQGWQIQSVHENPEKCRPQGGVFTSTIEAIRDFVSRMDPRLVDVNDENIRRHWGYMKENHSVRLRRADLPELTPEPVE